MENTWKCIFVVLALVHIVNTQTGCADCTSVPFTNAITYTPLNAGQIEISPFPEPVGSLGTFNLVRVGGSSPSPSPVFLAAEFNFTHSSGCCNNPTSSSCLTCPTGYRVANAQELRLIGSLNSDQLQTLKFNKTGGKNNSRVYYFSADKVVSCSFWALYWVNETFANVSSVALSATNVIKQYKCVLNSTSSKMTWKDENDMIQGAPKFFPNVEPTSRNWVSWNWAIGGTSLSTQKNLTLTPPSVGCYPILIQRQFFGMPPIAPECVRVYARAPHGSAYSPPTISADDLKTLNFPIPKYVPILINGYYGNFNSRSIPFAPFMGGFFAVFANKTGSTICIIEFNNDMEIVSNASTTISGSVHDAVASSDGSFIFTLIRNNHKLTLFKLRKDGSVVFESIIMDNPRFQLRWWQTTTSAPFGMGYIHSPSSGRLALGQGRVAILFAHYNDFNRYPDNPAGGGNHTGGTVITVEDDTGLVPLMATAWFTSHTLTERLVWDGSKFAAVQFGDAYPMNIAGSVFWPEKRTTFLDPVLKLYNQMDHDSNSNCVPGTIPSPGNGFTSGHLGGFHQISPNNYIFTYSRKAASATFNGNSVSSTVSELGFVRLNYASGKVTPVTTKSLFPFFDVTNVKSEKYGDKVLVYYTRNPKELNNNGLVSQGISNTDSKWLLLTDIDGTTITGPLQAKANITYDDMEVLSDGSIIWGYVDGSTANLKINYISANTSLSPSQRTTLIQSYNTYRAQSNLAPVTWSSLQAHLVYQTSYQCDSLATQAGYTNAAPYQTNVALVVDSWAQTKCSDNDCRSVCDAWRNIVSKDMTEVGCGIVSCPSTKYLVCKHRPTWTGTCAPTSTFEVTVPPPSTTGKGTSTTSQGYRDTTPLLLGLLVLCVSLAL